VVAFWSWRPSTGPVLGCQAQGTGVRPLPGLIRTAIFLIAGKLDRALK
jgi:hypothetical protein